MSWSYSQVLVAEYSDQCCSDTAPSALLNTTPMPDQFYWPDKTTEHSRLSRFGMTCVPLTDTHGEALLMSFLEASRARTSALPETEPDWTAKGQGYGEKWLGLLGRFDPDSCSLKTAQLSLLVDSTGCSPTLPRWGLMLDGELYPQPIPELCISGSASGYSPNGMDFFHTPTCDGLDGGSNSRKALKRRTAMFQTPVADDAVERKAGKYNSRGEPKLSAQVKIYPTPCADDTGARKKKYAQGGTPLSLVVGGHLNPDWEEWLMGWPIGHTALKPLATARFREFVRQHGNCSMDDREAA